jgi:hypothetical protein
MGTYSVYIKIGGRLPSNQVEELYDEINAQLFDAEQLDDLTEIEVGDKSGAFILEGCIEDEDSTSLLIDAFISKNLSFSMVVDNDGETEGTWYYVPEMTDANYIPVQVSTCISNVAPLINMLLDVAENGIDCLPLYQHKKGMEKIIVECLDSGTPTVQVLRNAINKFIPLEQEEVPEIPCLEITPGE